MARLLADENFPLPVVHELRRLGHDVATLDDLQRAGLGLRDEEVLALAKDDTRVLLTLNRRHFVRLHTDLPAHFGVVVCSLDIDFTRQARRISIALDSEGLLVGKLVRINRPG